MSWARLLVHVDGDAGSEALVGWALALGRRLSARVELLHVETSGDSEIPLTAEAMSAGALSQLIESLSQASRERAERAGSLYQKLCVEAGLPVCAPDDPPAPGRFRIGFRLVSGREADELARRGRLADAVLVGGPVSPEERYFVPGLEAALFETGRPVLLMPGEVEEGALDAIAIAWDGSREAARAAVAALPLLRAAKEVVVLTADMDWVEAKPSDLAGFLAEHGVTAKTWAFLPDGGPLGEALLKEVGEAGCGFLVMGAYGHSRLREMVMGGVTLSVIEKTTIPVLLMH